MINRAISPNPSAVACPQHSPADSASAGIAVSMNAVIFSVTSSSRSDIMENAPIKIVTTNRYVMKKPVSDISGLFRIMETLENSADNTASITIFKKADL